MTTQTLAKCKLIVFGPVAHTQQAHDMPKENDVVKVTVGVPGKIRTPEELDYAAAVKAAAQFNLPNKRLRAFAAKCQVPPEWYETDEEKPF
jgi:hypothetical protein